MSATGTYPEKARAAGKVAADGPGGGTGLGWALADSWTMTRRELAHWRRRPGQVVMGLVFPVMLLVMFGCLLGGGRGVEGAYVDFLVPGMLALTMAFGLEGTMLAVTQDLGKGVLDRFRTLPMHGGAVLVGRCAADLLQSAASLVVMVGAGLAVGWRPAASPGGFLGALGLLLLLRFAMLWVGIHLALLAGRPELLQAVQILVWPVGFLSNAFAVPSSMPQWLGAAVQWNPLSATAGAVRELFGAPEMTGGGAWAASHTGLLSVLWPLLLVAVFFPLAVRRFRRLGE